MSTKFVLHIPKLLEFTLHVVCDDIAKLGIAGLTKPMPLQVYLKCVSTFAAKYSKKLTIKGLYDHMRKNRDVESLPDDTEPQLDSVIVLITHIAVDSVIEEDEEILSSLFRSLIQESMQDIDGVMRCLHTFAAHCTAHVLHGFLVKMMSVALKCSPCAEIRRVLVHYGGCLDVNDSKYMYHACACGMRDTVQTLLNNGHQISTDDVYAAMRSGDYETLALLHSSLVSFRRKIDLSRHSCFGSQDAYDMTLEILETARNMGIISHRTMGITNIRSIDVALSAIACTDVENLIVDIASNAVSRGDTYTDVLHAVVEVGTVPVPRDTMSRITIDSITDWSVFDYLIDHGADLFARNRSSETVFDRYPLLLRFWLDRGLNVREYYVPIVREMLLEKSINITFIDIMMSALGLNTNDECGASMLWSAIEHSRYGIVDLMLKHCSCVNVPNEKGQTALHIACCQTSTRILRNILEHGSNPNARDNGGKTPLHVACRERARDMVELLLVHNADANVYDNNGQSPLYIATCKQCRDIAEILIRHGAVPSE